MTFTVIGKSTDAVFQQFRSCSSVYFSLALLGPWLAREVRFSMRQHGKAQITPNYDPP
jgi:hypothetical protein